MTQTGRSRRHGKTSKPVKEDIGYTIFLKS